MSPTQPPIQWVAGARYLGVNLPGRVPDHSPPSSAEIKECLELYLHYSSNTPSWRCAQLKAKATGTLSSLKLIDWIVINLYVNFYIFCTNTRISHPFVEEPWAAITIKILPYIHTYIITHIHTHAHTPNEWCPVVHPIKENVFK